MTKDKRLKDEINEALSELIDKDAKGLYRYWVETYAEPHIKKWLEEHNYNTETCRSFEYIKFMTDRFVDWVSNNK